MEDLRATLKNLQLTVQTLLKKYNQLKKENENLKNLNEEITLKLSEKNKLINAAEERIAVNTINTVFDTDEKQILQSKIDAYLKEIEKCLDLLNA